MKKDTITITRAEYEHLNKAANAAVEHACELFKAARLVDELQARINELNKECDDMAAYANVKEDEIVVLTIQNQKLKAYIDKQKEETVGLHVVEAVEAENTELKARIERVRLYGKNIAYTAKYRRNDWAMGEESATNFIFSILDGTHKD